MRKEQRQYFNDIWEVVHEMKKQEWAYHGVLQNTTLQTFYQDVVLRMHSLNEFGWQIVVFKHRDANW